METEFTIPPGSHRVFIGIPIDENSQREINNLLGPLKSSSKNIRWVPESNRHLTLAFPGNQQAAVVENLVRLFDQTYQQAPRFQYSMSTMTRFPGPEGRIIAIVNDPVRPLDRLFRSTLELLKTNNIEYDQKEFLPHITLGRIRRANRVKRNFFMRVNIDLRVEKVVLYKSTLTDSGPVYSILKQTRLAMK